MRRKFLFVLPIMCWWLDVCAQDAKWVLTTDAGVSVELENVNAFVASVEVPEVFSVLLSNGEAIQDVKEVGFSKVAGLSAETIGEGQSVLATGNGVIVSNLRAGAEVRVFDLMGKELYFCNPGGAGSITVSLEDFRPGYYILVVDGVSYKIERSK